jgi:hypothetical protein
MVRRLNVLIFAVIALAWFAASQPEYVAAQQPPGLARAIEAQERHTPGLLGQSGIVGTGVGVNPQGVPVIRVYVVTPGVPAPQALDNIPVERVVTGQIVAHCYQSECPRPVPLGVSTGHPDITAGTIGARVRSGANVFVLSNNHVYANQNLASIGDSVLQPGAIDGGSETDAIGTLADFEPINFSGGDNTIDAAIASTTTAMVQNVTFSGYKPTSTLAEAILGLDVKKEGRTTGVTIGQISEVNVTVNVCYAGFPSCTKLARFVNQFAVGGGGFSAGGDSGSLIVTSSTNNPVGLLFAGSSTRTIGNRIQAVLSILGVTIDDDSGTPPPSGIQLDVTGYKVKGVHHADLTWSGAPGSVDIFRNGINITTTANNAYTDNIGNRGGNASYTYKVCEASTATCSNEVTINF